MADLKPTTIANDLPDVERRVEKLKSRKERASPGDKSVIRQEEAEVEKAIDQLPQK